MVAVVSVTDAAAAADMTAVINICAGRMKLIANGIAGVLDNAELPQTVLIPKLTSQIQLFLFSRGKHL